MTNEYDLLDEEELREECIILSDALDQAIDEALEVRRQSGIHPNNFRETPRQMRERLCKKAFTDNYKTNPSKPRYLSFRPITFHSWSR